MIICTSIYAEDFPKAILMAKTVKKFMPGAKLVACLVEKDMTDVVKKQVYFDEVILAKDIGFEDFDRFIFKYSSAEASDVVKGQLLTYLMDKFKEEDIFIFMDPDIEVFGPFDELLDKLKEHDIIVLPHLCEPEKQLDAIKDNELWALRNGVYDLGCLALKRSKNTTALIEWWKVRLDKFCCEDILEGVPMGIFTEQRWFCLVPGFFDVHVFKHAGYNFGTRNLTTRKVTIQDGKYLVNGVPLRFCHFSGIDSGDSDYMFSKYVPDLTDPVYVLRDRYTQQLEEMQRSTAGDWTYDCFTSGEKIKTEVRELYRKEPWRAEKAESPFDMSNQELINNVCSDTKALYSELTPHSNKNTFVKAIEYFQRHGLRKTLKKIREKCLGK